MTKQPELLTIRQLLNQDNYIVPIYQRNYAWGSTEIELLLTDIYQAFERQLDNYYIGSLVVFERDDGLLEVIDGQQRLTTFTILASFLIKKYPQLPLNRQANIDFEHREDSKDVLKILFNSSDKEEKLSRNFYDALKVIEKNWINDIDFANFLLEKVQIIRTQVPAETDLNHYFEIMNTRGEQLEKHEILKARFMSQLADNKERVAFATIWDACSDMARYMVMGFDANIRKSDDLFGQNWNDIPNNFESIAQYFQNTQNQESEAKTLAEIIQHKSVSDLPNEMEKSERFHSVIDFPNFLMHVLRIYLEFKQASKDKIKEVSLDEKYLLETFILDSNDDIKQFAMVLLKCRYLFDKYVIKSDDSKSDDDHWPLLLIKPCEKSKYSFNNTFGKNQQKTVLLLSMFHVSHPARIYKNWLYAVLRWLFKQENIGEENYSDFLENLSERYYFNYYGKENRTSDDFFDIIYDDICIDKSERAKEVLNELLNTGTSVPNFIFNRLDYLLWKNQQGKYQNFRFTFRNSVEHFYPQNPDNNPRLESSILHCFGNLCLVSSSTNSKFGNNMPKAKEDNFGNHEFHSLKLNLMMSKANNWNENTIKKHDKEMKAILNQ